MPLNLGVKFQYLLVCTVLSVMALLYWSGHASYPQIGILPRALDSDPQDDGQNRTLENEVEEKVAEGKSSDYGLVATQVDTAGNLNMEAKKELEEANLSLESQPSVHTDNKEKRSGDKLKTILYWNTWYSKQTYGFGSGHFPFYKHNCPEKRCRATADVDEFDQADAVVICGRLLDWDQEEVVPRRRDEDQVFVYFNNEAPVKTLGKTERLKNVFNVTMTYRTDSTIPFPYSRIVPRIDKDGYRPVTTEDIKEKSKEHIVSWMVSRCNKPGCVRHEYAEQLNEHMPVDVYGRCGNLRCERYDNGTCMDYQERKYKFYMAFENTVCEDYITEKAFRTLNYNIVPVVMGGANYTKLLPPHSFIDVRDFEDPAALARYLRHLDEHDDEYLAYFAWKSDYEVQDVTIDEPFCKLCELLHSGEEKFLVDFDLERWWDEGGGEACVSNGQLPFLYKYFNIKSPLTPRTRGRGPKGRYRKSLLTKR